MFSLDTPHVPVPPCYDGVPYIDFGVPKSETRPDMEAFYGNCKMMEYVQKPISGKHVTEAIGDAYLTWRSEIPVLIDAPTGAGKSTFVCEKLIPLAYANGANLLLVSNRTALVQQQRREVINAVAKFEPWVDPAEEVKYIKDVMSWGNVCVCTYHGLESLLDRAKVNMLSQGFFDNLLYAVFDEIHFLYADSTFTSCCASLVENIPAYFYRTIRIYMTAASDSICNTLIHSERNAYYTMNKLFGMSHMRKLPVRYNPCPPKPSFLHYSMKANYDQYNLHFFTDNGPICLISADEAQKAQEKGVKGNEKSFSKKEVKKKSNRVDALRACIPKPSYQSKTLIFVQRREDGLALEKALNKDCSKDDKDAVFIDRMSKLEPETNEETTSSESEAETYTEDTQNEKLRKNEAWNTLLETGQFQYKVMIATSVIDCGINIKDPNLKTIAIFANEKTEFLQMIGRKRLNIDSQEKVDVWVYIPKANSFSRLVAVRERELKLAEQLNFIKTFQSEDTGDQAGTPHTYLTRGEDGLVNGSKIVYDNLHSMCVWQRTEKLCYEFPLRFDNEQFFGFYRKLQRNLGIISDKALFQFNRFGMISASSYVQWVVTEKKRYYEEMKTADFRYVVSSWMGKEQDLQNQRESKKNELISFLNDHLEKTISVLERSTLCRLTAETHALFFSEGTRTLDWNSMKVKSINKLLQALEIPYKVSTKSKNSKDWVVKYEPR